MAIATSGYIGQRSKGEGAFTWLVSEAFASALPAADVARRVSTFVVLKADGALPGAVACLGRQVVARGRSRMNRQAQIVARSDILCVGGGSTGTADFVRLALLIDRPVLPLPFFAGASRDLWFRYRAEIQSEFGMPDEQVARWSQTDPARLSAARIEALAQEIVAALLDTARGNCLVCMPFAEHFLPVYDRLVSPAIAAAHLHPLRMDQEPTVGDIAESLRAEIGAARCLVAVVDERNPNVLYEVGFAHALDKPVILLQREDGARADDPALPFDIRTHRVVRYPGTLDGEPLQRCIDTLHGLLRAVTQAR